MIIPLKPHFWHRNRLPNLGGLSPSRDTESPGHQLLSQQITLPIVVCSGDCIRQIPRLFGNFPNFMKTPLFASINNFILENFILEL